MHANKFTGQNFEREMAMATTLIENIVNELTELVVQKVMEEFNQRTDEVAARLNVLELERFDLVHRADLCSNFVARDDLLVDEALINDRLVAMENALSAQPVVDANFVDERINDWMQRRLKDEIVYALERVDLEYEVTNIIDRYDMTGKIEDTLRDFDLGVEEAVEDEIRNRTLVTEDDLIEFLNDRVRLTTE